MQSPIKINDSVSAFAKTLSDSGEIIQIKCQQHKYAEVNECFDAVNRYITEHDGKRVLGWFIGEWTNVLLFAELHAVCQRQDGSWIDVAHHPVNRRKILFVPDQNAKIPEIQQENRFFALANDPAISEYIDLEHLAFLAAKPDSKYVNPEDPKLLDAQFQLLHSKAALAKRYGWPKGTSMTQRLKGNAILNIYT